MFATLWSSIKEEFYNMSKNSFLVITTTILTKALEKYPKAIVGHGWGKII